MKFKKQILQLLLLLLLSFNFVYCFGEGLDKTGSVIGFKDNQVQTQGQAGFKLGSLPSHWKQTKIKERVLLFEHKEVPASVSVSAWCGLAFDDAPLNSLVAQNFTGFVDLHQQESRLFLLDEREALYTKLTGKLDGVLVYLESVLLKKEGCLYDFLYVSKTPQNNLSHEFQEWVRGFKRL